MSASTRMPRSFLPCDRTLGQAGTTEPTCTGYQTTLPSCGLRAPGATSACELLPLDLPQGPTSSRVSANRRLPYATRSTASPPSPANCEL